jgi:hypothetical protein
MVAQFERSFIWYCLLSYSKGQKHPCHKVFIGAGAEIMKRKTVGEGKCGIGASYFGHWNTQGKNKAVGPRAIYEK